MTSELPKLNSKNIFAGGDIPPNASLEEPKSSANRELDTNNLEVRVNQYIQRADDNEQPLIKIKGTKLEIDGKSNIQMDIVNSATDEVIGTFSQNGDNLVSTYTSVLTEITQFLISERINPLKIKLPQLDDLENF